MSIRTRLLKLLLPPLIAFVTLISLFFYYNWQSEILSSFRSKLITTVSGIAGSLPSSKIRDIIKGDNKDSEPFQSLESQLSHIAEQTGVQSIFIVKISPVNKGERVLLDRPAGENNPVYDGKDPKFAYRQTYLLEAGPFITKHHGEQDFSESNEKMVYFTKSVLATEPYEERLTNERIMTAYAPLIDERGDVLALLGADVSMAIVDQKIRSAALVILLSSIATIALVILSVFASASVISTPVKKIKDAALSIAAGEYGTLVDVEGPTEVKELANTLNTMSECMMENIERLRLTATARERLYGEYECALLLQERMFKRQIELMDILWTELHGIHTQLAQQPRGILINSSSDNNSLYLLESTEDGFEGMYQLLMNGIRHIQEFPNIELRSLGSRQFAYAIHDMPSLFLWSDGNGSFIEGHHGNISLKKDDIVVITNHVLWDLLKNKEAVYQWYSRVLKHFALEKSDLYMKMFQQEMTFLSHEHHLEKDIYLLTIVIK